MHAIPWHVRSFLFVELTRGAFLGFRRGAALLAVADLEPRERVSLARLSSNQRPGFVVRVRHGVA